jgi:ParB/RepB/Spo0J family partition protein
MKRLKQYDVFHLPVEDIFYDEEFNCRGSFTLQSIGDLADSIRLNDLQFPIVVQPYKKEPGYKYRLLAGHRRFKAVTTILGWTEVPATVRKRLSEHQARIINLTENLERKDLNILEEAKALCGLYPDGVSLRKAAKEIKRPTRWIHIRRKLLAMPEEVQKWAAAGMISAVNIETISQLTTEGDQIQAATEITRSKKKYGKTRRLRVRPEYRRKFRQRKTKQELSDMIAHLFEVQCNGFATRLLAWAGGQLTDAEIERDIQHAPGYKKAKGYVSPYADD